MIRFILTRLAQSVVVVFCVISITFILVRLAPGGPFENEKIIPEHIKQQIIAFYGLDQPLAVQYVRYMGNFLQGDLGASFANEGFSVNEMIAAALPVSAGIGLAGLSIALIIGVPLGIIAAARRNRWQDYSAMSLAMLGVCLPTFVLGSIFSLILGVKLKLVPALGWNNLATDWVLPSATLGLFYVGYIARLSRAGMLEMLSQDFVRTARAKGLPEWKILLKHCLKGGILPVVTFLGPAIAQVIGGLFVIETVFHLPGLGRHFINAASNRDYTLLLGIVATSSVLVLAMNFLADVAGAALNPRQRVTGDFSER